MSGRGRAFKGAGREAATRSRRGGIRLTVSAMVAAVVLSGEVLAQTYTFNSFDVQGNTRIEAASILSSLGVTPGQPISAGALNAGYQRLQASGLFRSVDLMPEGNRLVVMVQEFPTINRVSIEGNARIPDDALLSVIGSQERRVYNPALAEQDAAAITEAYTQGGRIAATVQPRIIERSENRVDLVFEVAEGRVSEIERISFVGNRDFSGRRLRRVLETTQAGLFRSIIRSDTFVAERVAVDRQLLQDFYLSRGYADAEILSATPELSPDRDAYFLTFRIREGQQFGFGRVGVSSALPEIDLAQYQSEIRVGPDDLFTPQAIDQTVQRLELLATQQGRTFIRVRPQFSRNPSDQTIDTTFVIERGPRVFVERIDIEGNATTLDRVIRREFATVEGDPFNPREIRAAADRIRALGYFAQADVTAREGSTDEQVIVDVDVEEQPTGALGFGVNYSVQRGAGVAFNFSESNFLGRGQTVNFDIDTASDNSSSQLSFTEPFFLNRDLALNFSLFYIRNSQDNLTFDSRIAGFRTGIDFPSGEFSRLGLYYGIKRDELDAREGVELSPILLEDEGEATTSFVGYSWTYSTIGRGLDPTRGYRLRFGQEFAGVGGDEEYVQTTFAATAQRTVRNEEVILNATFEGGTLVNLRDGNSREANRFFNNQSIIRGFEAGGIGPRDLNFSDDALGGNTFVAARLEAQFPIGLIPEEYGVAGATFLDAGSVWGLDEVSASGPIPIDDDFYLNSAVGVGILWDTAIGPLRFNFTRAIRKRDYDLDQNFDLTIQTRF
ncbi:outer membrane protein assembly factor BamA [uncultured Jannaschia sp.]|uniref:outer membrane protein assembly factor BamA n=1 Tax=uncultured Jannaschia sp. TaxID=293347 RepID=UPI002639C578|nr:outer membrane protein assembly factor BamA [uncultured Jannaschia sp.]